MREAAERLVDKTNEAMELTMKEMMSLKNIKCMDETNLKLFKLTLELIEVSNNYVIESAKIIEGLDRKMNELLKGAKGV